MHFLKSDLAFKKIILFGVPAIVVGFAGFYYIYRLYNNSSQRKPLDPIDDHPIESPPDGPLGVAIALKNRGNKYFKGRKYAQAVECYTEALEKCPVEANPEIATFYQNRAAAYENLSDYAKAIEDCTAALELSPKYLKALNRRAHLLEKQGSHSQCLLDATACCLLERFQNGENVLFIDRVLKKIGEQMAKEERQNLPHNLPSPAFIKNYLSAFAWNPFEVATPVSDVNNQDSPVPQSPPVSAFNEQHKENHPASEPDPSNGEKEASSEPLQTTVFELPHTLLSAYEALDKSLELMDSDIYEASMKWAAKAVKSFNTSPKVELADFARSKLGSREQPVAARARALLIDATYKALRGLSEEAKTQFALVGEEMYANPVVRVNALIKAACLTMTIDQNIAGCLYTFQQAQTLSPDCPDVFLHRGQIHLLAEQLDEAMLDLNEAVKLKPDFSVAQAQRLYSLYRLDMNSGKMDRAELRVNEFRKLTEKYPSCLESHSLYAQVLTERGEFEQGDREFGRVIELAPKSGMAYAHRGLLQLRWHQDTNAAAEWLRKGIEVDPQCELALELLGQLSMEKGNFEEALEYFNRSIQQAKTLPDLTHLVSLREGVKAQMHVCKKYDLSISEMFSSLKQELKENNLTP